MTTTATIQEQGMFPEEREQEILTEEAVRFMHELPSNSVPAGAGWCGRVAS